MNVLYSTDDKYLKICLTSIVSLLKYNKDVNIYIIENNLTKKMKNELKEIIYSYKATVSFISCEEICKDMKKNNEFSIAAYARLFIEDKVDTNKILYIDADTIIVSDLSKLWNTDIKDNYIGAVLDTVPYYLKEAVEMKEEDKYVNSGVMLINLKKWREENFKEKVLEYIKCHRYNVVHHDQGILNGICNGKIYILPPNNNVMPEFLMMNADQIKKLYHLKEYYSNDEIDYAKNHPKIIHFLEKFYNRPWYYECTHPYKNNFLDIYLKNGGELKNKPLSKKIKIRKFIYENFPFSFFIFVENILNIRRKKYIKK